MEIPNGGSFRKSTVNPVWGQNGTTQPFRLIKSSHLEGYNNIVCNADEKLNWLTGGRGKESPCPLGWQRLAQSRQWRLWNMPESSPGQSSSVASIDNCLFTDGLRKKKEKRRVGESPLKFHAWATKCWGILSVGWKRISRQNIPEGTEFIKSGEQR